MSKSPKKQSASSEPKLMSEQEYEEYLDNQISGFEKKLREIEKKRAERVPITIQMITQCCIKQNIQFSQPLEQPSSQGDTASNVDNLKTEDEGEDANEAEGEGDTHEHEGDHSEQVGVEIAEGQEEAKPEQPQEEDTQQQVEDNQLEQVTQLEHIHLEFKNLTDIESLERFTRLESLYLQHNRITELKGLEN